VQNGYRIVARVTQVAVVAGLATISAGCGLTNPTPGPTDYQIIWTFVNNTQGSVMMFGIDQSAGQQNCQDGSACRSTTPVVSLLPHDSKATNSSGPGGSASANLTGHVQGVNAVGVLNGVSVLSGFASVTVTWDGTNITIAPGHS
jgi:hypothetical protein